jgi:tripartite ATP-independent transporter DctM subunit
MWFIPIIFILLLISGTAFAYLMGAVSVLTFVAVDKTQFLSILPQRIFAQLDVFAFMAMPLFILTAEIMSRAGVTRSLIDFAMSIVGRFRGGLGHVNILTSVFFAGISGSAIADSAALSRTFVPEMKTRGYDPYYAGAITAASSMIGPIIPPSIIMIIYGGLTGASVAALFIAGVIPGLMLAAALMILNAVIAHMKGHPGGASDDLPGFLPSLLNAAPALCLPVVILGSLVFGLATPTEGSAIAVFFALIAGQFYKGLNWRMIFGKNDRHDLYHPRGNLSSGVLGGPVGLVQRAGNMGRLLRADRHEIPVFPSGHLSNRRHVHGHACSPDPTYPTVRAASVGARHQPDTPWPRALL